MSEAKELIYTDPKQLSLDEMFQVARTYDTNSREFKEVFEIAVRMYPDDPVSNLNAANSALLNGDTAAARRYLAKAAEGPEKRLAEGVACCWRRIPSGPLPSSAPWPTTSGWEGRPGPTSSSWIYDRPPRRPRPEVCPQPFSEVCRRCQRRSAADVGGGLPRMSEAVSCGCHRRSPADVVGRLGEG